MRKKTIKTREQIVADLKSKHDIVASELQDSVYTKRAYVNLPLNLLERTFFDICAKEVFHLDQTKLLRSIIHKLMARHPDIVDKAKQQIENG